jgi:hypothetical protein
MNMANGLSGMGNGFNQQQYNNNMNQYQMQQAQNQNQMAGIGQTLGAAAQIAPLLL